ncbi:hypothetical protein TNCV_825651 [Trichonephila clavipes]|nr:hypothetical protein TNCV_825651 [Trichonephila clavipes]
MTEFTRNVDYLAGRKFGMKYRRRSSGCFITMLRHVSDCIQSQVVIIFGDHVGDLVTRIDASGNYWRNLFISRSMTLRIFLDRSVRLINRSLLAEDQSLKLLAEVLF